MGVLCREENTCACSFPVDHSLCPTSLLSLPVELKIMGTLLRTLLPDHVNLAISDSDIYITSIVSCYDRKLVFSALFLDFRKPLDVIFWILRIFPPLIVFSLLRRSSSCCKGLFLLFLRWFLGTKSGGDRWSRDVRLLLMMC